MRALWLPLAALSLVACGDGGSDDGTDSDTGPTADDTDTGTTIGGNTGNTEDTSAELNGTIYDAAGAPLAGADIRFCRGQECRTAETEADGTYRFDNTAVDWLSFEVKPPAGSGLVTGFVPLGFETDVARTVDVTLPQSVPPTAFGSVPAEVDIAGLLVTVGADDLEPPMFVDPATEVGGALVPTADWLPSDGIAGTVVAVWYLEPFDHHAANGLPLRFDLTDLGLSGPSYRGYVGSYETSEWIDLGTVTGSGGVYEGGLSLPLMSTVILVEE